MAPRDGGHLRGCGRAILAAVLEWLDGVGIQPEAVDERTQRRHRPVLSVVLCGSQLGSLRAAPPRPMGNQASIQRHISEEFKRVKVPPVTRSEH